MRQVSRILLQTLSQVVLQIHEGVLSVTHREMIELCTHIHALQNEAHVTNLFHSSSIVVTYLALLTFKKQNNFKLVVEVDARKASGLRTATTWSFRPFVPFGCAWPDKMTLECGRIFKDVSIFVLPRKETHARNQNRKYLEFLAPNPRRLGFKEQFRLKHGLHAFDWVICPMLKPTETHDRFLIASVNFAHVLSPHPETATSYWTHEWLHTKLWQSEQLNQVQEEEPQINALKDAHKLPTAHLTLSTRNTGQMSYENLLKLIQTHGTHVHFYNGHATQGKALKLVNVLHHACWIFEPSRLDPTDSQQLRFFTCDSYGYPEVERMGSTYFVTPKPNFTPQELAQWHIDRKFAQAEIPKSSLFVQPAKTFSHSIGHDRIDYLSAQDEFSDILQEEGADFRAIYQKRRLFFELIPISHDSNSFHWRWPTPEERRLRRLNRRRTYNGLPAGERGLQDPAIRQTLHANNASYHGRATAPDAKVSRPVSHRAPATMPNIQISHSSTYVRPGLSVRRSTRLVNVGEHEEIEMVEQLPHQAHPSSTSSSKSNVIL